MTEHRGRVGRRAPWAWVVAWPAAVGLVAAVAILGASGEIPVDSRQSDPPAASAPASAVALASSPTAPRVSAWLRREVGGLSPGPMSLAAGLGRIWVASPADGTVRAINPRFAQVVLVARVSAPALPADEASPVLAVAGRSIWAAGMTGRREVLRIAPDTGEVLAAVPVPSDVEGLLGDERSVWAITKAGVLGIDPRTGTVAVTIPGTMPVHAALGSRWLWLSSGSSIQQIDPATGRVVADMDGGGGPIGVRNGTVWARTPGTTSTMLTAIDEASGNVLERASVGTSGNSGLAWALPGIEASDPADDRTAVAPRQPHVLETTTATWIARPAEGQLWRVVHR